MRRPDLRPLRRVFLLVTLLGGRLVSAAPVDDALVALLRGQPDAAVTLLTGRNDAPSLALLARSYVGQAVFVPTDAAKRALYARSEAAARAALAADPRNADAHVELANALALQLPGTGLVKATQVGREIRTLYERAVTLDPGQARGWMGLGGWHAQALALGSLVALAVGASEQAMRDDHRRAIELEPNEVFYRLTYADDLLLLAKAQPRRAGPLTAEARGVLTAAAALTPTTYWQAYDLKQVRERLRVLGR
ncbi:hypothetical protein HNQ07_004733 [Deinococcus metalli]|uniref:Uncharacterized protein n=1 Tax=Deinococcus metalli TaxID=1141878 RepID=A0A7W8NTK3_9DEIO|nr:hypothetical protein [Deinococcus metalli]MBB5379218.1 hypothetical protein [Deinococcus metalli]GHF65506.1 hypothetical protein GCM10017781_46500 [Deinococcus metalli]